MQIKYLLLLSYLIVDCVLLAIEMSDYAFYERILMMKTDTVGLLNSFKFFPIRHTFCCIIALSLVFSSIY